MPENEDVYTSPSSDVAIHLQCPKCPETMEQGYIQSSTNVTWVGKTQSKIKVMFLGGEKIAKVSSGIGCKYYAHYCKSCKLFILNH